MNPHSRRDFFAFTQLLLYGCATRRSSAIDSDSLKSSAIPTPRGMLFNVFNGELTRIVENPVQYLLDVAAEPEVMDHGIAMLNRVGTPIFQIVEADICRSLLRDKEKVDKSIFHKNLRPVFGSGIVFSNASEKTLAVRRSIDPLLKPSETERYVAALQKELEDYTSQLQRRIDADGGETLVDITEELTRVLQRSLLSSLFGYENHPGAEPQELSELYTHWKTMILESEVLASKIFTPKRSRFSKTKRTRDSSRKHVSNFFSNLLKEREQREARQNTSLADAINGLPETFDEVSRVDEMITLFAASHETTANCLNFTILHLCQSKNYLEALRNAPLKPTDSNDRRVLRAEWLRAATFEGLRLSPPVWLLPRSVATDGLEINGHKIPKGSLLFISPLVTQRQPRYWVQGITADQSSQLWNATSEFDPRRFLPPNKDSGLEPGPGIRSTKAFLAFGYGHRACPGRPLGHEDLITMIDTLTSHFDFERADTEKPDFTATFLYRLHNLKIKVRRRSREQ